MASQLFDAVPQELKACNQWVLWKYEEREGKITKVPYQKNGVKKASSTNPKTWCSFEEAAKALEFRLGDGIGFVITRGRGISFGADGDISSLGCGDIQDPYSGIDLDHCRDKLTGKIDEWANQIIFELALPPHKDESLDSYVEVSPSGEGIHVIVLGSIPKDRKGGKKNLVGPEYRPKAAIEIYSEGRFFTVTGKPYFDTPIRPHPTVFRLRQDELRTIYLKIFGADEEDNGKVAQKTPAQKKRPNLR